MRPAVSPSLPEIRGLSSSGSNSVTDRNLSLTRQMKISNAAASAFLVCYSIVPAASAQTASDSSAIRQTALDYIQGWYAGDAARMERALHPELAKRIVRTDANGNLRLDQQSAMTLVQGTRNGVGTRTPQANRRDEVRILDIFRNAASVRVDASRSEERRVVKERREGRSRHARAVR